MRAEHLAPVLDHLALLDRLSRRLRAYYKGKLARIGRGAAEAEDLVQEAILAIHLKRHTYAPAEPLTPWVHAIARYKLIDHLRGNKMSRIDVPIDDHQELMARDDHASTEGTHDMTKLLGRLPRKTRQAIEAVKLEGKSVTETAARYGMSESNVKISIHRGLKALASFIGRCRRRIIEKPRRWAFLQLPDSSFSPRRD